MTRLATEQRRRMRKCFAPVELFLILILLAAAPALAQTSAWEESMASAYEAYQASRFAEAEKLFLSALATAEDFGPQDPRLATTLNNLAELQRAQGRYAKAEPLYKRSLGILEKALGPEHPDVAARPAIGNDPEQSG